MRAERSISVTAEVLERFWARVAKGSPDECWEWTGEKHSNGYGIFRKPEKERSRFLTHRLSLLIDGRDITGLVVRHDCDNPPCVNPNHLRVGTQADNVRDTVQRGRHNTSGLELGRSFTYPERPCRSCGVTLEASRTLYCPSCRLQKSRESRAAWVLRNRPTTERQRAAMVRGAA